MDTFSVFTPHKVFRKAALEAVTAAKQAGLKETKTWDFDLHDFKAVLSELPDDTFWTILEIKLVKTEKNEKPHTVVCGYILPDEDVVDLYEN